VRQHLALVALALGVAGCGGAPADPAPPSRVGATLAGASLMLEVADDPAERARGLMGRTSVPPGTGMVFRYDEPSTDRFWMRDVPIALRATFVRGGVVLHSVVMAPCREPEPRDCPTYGAPAPFDTVVETAPDAVPGVVPGARFVLSGPSSSMR